MSFFGQQIHFRQGHFLCEDEACLAKKFVVFQSEAEMKVTWDMERKAFFMCLVKGSRLLHYTASSLHVYLFIFQRHNTIEHGGKLSRSKRNAALQVFITSLPVLLLRPYLVFQICACFLYL